MRPVYWLLPVTLVICLVALSPAQRAVKPKDPPSQGPSGSETPTAKASEAVTRPKLVVFLVFDQLRGDYFGRWEKHFGEGGLKRLMHEGAWFRNCHYNYALTLTAAGHASMSTGCGPLKHGIVANEWYDRDVADFVTSVESNRYKQVPPNPPAKAGTKAKAEGAWPGQRMQPSVGDVLMRKTAGRAKVVSLSIKDRSAILLAALLSRAVYWFNATLGSFVTSTYYTDAPAPWVLEFNRARPADRFFGKDWQPLRDKTLDYNAIVGPDRVLGEGLGYVQGTTFPHPTTGGLKTPGPRFYDAVACSPFGNELLLEFAKKAIVAEELGKDEVPDLLCVSFSSNDLIGHNWGPDSHEVLDVTLRTDLIVKDLLDHLDTTVGKGQYAVVLCADHGICPLPEVSRSKGLQAVRHSAKLLQLEANAFMEERFGDKSRPTDWFDKVHYPWLYLNPRVLSERKIYSADAEHALADWLVRRGDVAVAYSQQALTTGTLTGKLQMMARRSMYPGRSGDVMFILKPYDLMSSYPTGTTHGSPYEYDTHVPLLAYGPGIPGGSRDEAVTPLHVAPILSHFLGQERPVGAEEEVPRSLIPGD